MKTDRVQAFSDGIFAILITILVLEFNLTLYSEGHLFEAVLRQWPFLFAYVMTFSYIGILWLFHHDLFSCIVRKTTRLNVLNLFSIFLTTLLSYSMSLLSESLATTNRDDMRFSIALYALLALGISLSYFLFYRYLSKNENLLSDAGLRKHFGHLQRFPLISSLIYLLAFVFCFLRVFVSLVFQIAGIAFHGIAYWRVTQNKNELS